MKMSLSSPKVRKYCGKSRNCLLQHKNKDWFQKGLKIFLLDFYFLRPCQLLQYITVKVDTVTGLKFHEVSNTYLTYFPFTLNKVVLENKLLIQLN